MRKYKHFKGGVYEFLFIAEHSENAEKLVIYRNEDGVVYARPFEMFFGTVIIDGVEYPRFKEMN